MPFTCAIFRPEEPLDPANATGNRARDPFRQKISESVAQNLQVLRARLIPFLGYLGCYVRVRET